MNGRQARNISLTPEFERFIAEKVDGGQYRSASEVVREGLRLLQERDAERAAALDEVRKKVRAGLDSLDRGEGLDGDEAIQSLREALRKRSGRGE